jgi:hypothetical protein
MKGDMVASAIFEKHLAGGLPEELTLFVASCCHVQENQNRSVGNGNVCGRLADGSGKDRWGRRMTFTGNLC